MTRQAQVRKFIHEHGPVAFCHVEEKFDYSAACMLPVIYDKGDMYRIRGPHPKFIDTNRRTWWYFCNPKAVESYETLSEDEVEEVLRRICMLGLRPHSIVGSYNSSC